MGLLRQMGALLIGLFVFFAIITALSRLLAMKELPTMLNDSSLAVANLFVGAFGGRADSKRVVGPPIPREQ